MINIERLPHTETDVAGMSPIHGALQKLPSSRDLRPKILVHTATAFSSQVSDIWSGGGELAPKCYEAGLEGKGLPSTWPDTSTCAVAQAGTSLQGVQLLCVSSVSQACQQLAGCVQ